MLHSLKISVLLTISLVVKVATANVVPMDFNSLGLAASQETIIIGSEYLDTEKKYHVTWLVNKTEDTIYFQVRAETTGYVGFGLSPNGGMLGADIFIAGEYANRTKYGWDFHGVGNTAPEIDIQQNYPLHFAVDNSTHTIISFRRLLNTCDKQDMIITDSTMRLIWSMGESDNISYHGGARGTKSVNLFLGNSSFDPSVYETVDFLKTTPMLAEHTMQWCSIHQLPSFNTMQHIVAFEPILENLDAQQHTAHVILYRCQAPAGQDAEQFFGPWWQSYLHWSKGGKRMELPPDVGLPLEASEYFAMQVHYDNPQRVSGKTFPTGARLFYTDQLRPIEAGLLHVGHHANIQLTIPPKTENFVVAGHCSPECTQNTFPNGGITVFNSLLHTHMNGRNVKLRHFRQSEELPWLDNEDYFDFEFQQNKPLQSPRKVKSGDQLTIECTYDSRWSGSGVVTGGLSMQEEVCQGWMYYYPRLGNLRSCDSSQTMEKHMNMLGIANITKGQPSYPGGTETYTIVEPENLAGDYVESLSSKFDWSTEFTEAFQQEKRFGTQLGSCSSSVSKIYQDVEVKYPENLQEYQPDNNCDGVTGLPTATTSRPVPTTHKYEDDECEYGGGHKWVKYFIVAINSTLNFNFGF